MGNPWLSKNKFPQKVFSVLSSLEMEMHDFFTKNSQICRWLFYLIVPIDPCKGNYRLCSNVGQKVVKKSN